MASSRGWYWSKDREVWVSAAWMGVWGSLRQARAQSEQSMFTVPGLPASRWMGKVASEGGRWYSWGGGVGRGHTGPFKPLKDLSEGLAHKGCEDTTSESRSDRFSLGAPWAIWIPWISWLRFGDQNCPKELSAMIEISSLHSLMQEPLASCGCWALTMSLVLRRSSIFKLISF